MTITPVACRHIGAAGREVEHYGFVIKGSQCLWFTGDSSPTAWRGKDLPKPDVLAVPYAYVNTSASWTLTQSFGAKKIVLLHMPPKDNDPAGLWPAVETAADITQLQIPQMGETLYI